MNKLITIEISRANFVHNIKTIRRLIGTETILAATIKANAYGHGLIECAKILGQAGADWLCLNSVDEAVSLRENGVNLPLLVLGHIAKDDLPLVVKYNLKPLIYDLSLAGELSRLARKNKMRVPVHVKIDTGMSRQGVLCKSALSLVKKLTDLSGIDVEGLATHFATADEADDTSYFLQQKNSFRSVIEEISESGHKIPFVHSANSAVSLLNGAAMGNLVRPGISIYGLMPNCAMAKLLRKKKIALKPVLSLKTRIAAVKTLPKGAGVSYGKTFITKKETKVGILPIGYYDGLDRKLSNQGEVLIQGTRCPILGRVCMNITVVDVSHLPKVKANEEVVIIGKQGGAEITADELAEKIGTINYEVVTRFRESIERKVV